MMANSSFDLESKSEMESEHAKLKDIDLTCLICQQSLHHPRVLDCLHSFCEECIVNNITKVDNESQDMSQDSTLPDLETSYIKCFRCFEITEIIDEDVSMLPYNFFANNAIDYLLIQCTKENAILCTSCSDESDAISRCVECSEFLCARCVTAHKRLRVTKDHKVIALDTLRYDKSSVHRPVHCPDHDPEVFTYYCEKCQDLICKECTILEHRGHKYERLSDALESLKPETLNFLEENEKKKVPPIEKAIDDVEDMAARLHARTVATKQAVKNCTAQCIRAIEGRCHDLLRDIDCVYKQKSQVLQQQKNKLQLDLMKNKSATDFINYAFKHGSEAEVFELLDIMKMRLKKLNAEQLDYKEPNENDVIDHVYESNAVEHIADNLGEISTSRVFLAHTRVFGPGLHTAKVGIEAFFIIEVYDRDGNKCVENMHDESIRVKVQAPESFYINNKIQNNMDGSYIVRYTPVTKGKYEITVKIRGRGFPNNKYIARVFEGIDYSKIETSYLSYGNTHNKQSLKHPWGIAVDENGKMYVTDHGNNRVVIFDEFGSYLAEFGSKGTKNGQFHGPTGIAIDPSGIIYVGDWENHRVQLFGPSGTFIAKFGSKGANIGELCHPAGIVIDKNGHVVVAERDNNRLQVFTADGKFVRLIGNQGNKNIKFDSPTHIAVREDNTYIVADAGNNRIVFLECTGKIIESVGTKGSRPGEFNRPSGLACDREGYVIAGDFHNHRVQVFTPTLKAFVNFGREGSNDVEFKHPSGLTLTNDGRIAVVDRYNNRIQVF